MHDRQNNLVTGRSGRGFKLPGEKLMIVFNSQGLPADLTQSKSRMLTDSEPCFNLKLEEGAELVGEET